MWWFDLNEKWKIVIQDEKLFHRFIISNFF